MSSGPLECWTRTSRWNSLHPFAEFGGCNDVAIIRMSRLQAISSEWKELLQKTRIQKANTIAIYCGRMEQGFFSSSLTSDWSQSTHSCPRVEESATRQPAWILDTVYLSYQRKPHWQKPLGLLGARRTSQNRSTCSKIQSHPNSALLFRGVTTWRSLAPSWCSLRRRRCCCGTPRPENGLFGGFGSHSWQWSH